MLWLGWIAVAGIALMAILLGSISVAWRRAVVRITRRVVGFGNPQLMRGFTPHFVASRQGWALLLLVAAAVLALILFTWKAALLVFVITYASMELAGFAYPRSDSDYYVQRIIQDLETWYRIHTQFGEATKAEEVKRRLDVITSAYQAGDLSPGRSR